MLMITLFHGLKQKMRERERERERVETKLKQNERIKWQKRKDFWPNLTDSNKTEIIKFNPRKVSHSNPNMIWISGWIRALGWMSD